MNKNIERLDEIDLRTLVSDIAVDAQKLISQQMELVRLELLNEIRQAKTGALSIGAGIGLLAMSGILATHTLVHLLHKSTRLPLWACYGIVAGLSGTVGAKLVHSGGKKIADVQLLPPPQTTQALKENLAWLKQQTTTY